MAVGVEYAAVTKEAVVEKLGVLSSGYNELFSQSSQFRAEGISNLKHQVEILKQKEARFFKLLNLTGDPQECLAILRRRISSLHTFNFSSLSGPALYQQVLSSYKAAIKGDGKEDYKLQQYLEAYLRQEGKTLDQDKIEEFTEQEILKLFSQKAKDMVSIEMKSGKGNSTTQVNIGGLRSVQGFGRQIKDIVLSKMTDAAKRDARLFIKWFESQQSKSYNKTVKNVEATLQNDAIVFTGYAQATQVEGQLLTPKEAEKILKDKPKILDKIWEQTINYIISVTNADPTKMRNIINTKIRPQNEYRIFLGQNINDLTGFLGEIETLYILSELMDTKIPDESLKWLANALKEEGATGKESSTDVVLEGLGIQTKNTAQDIFSGHMRNISFTKLKIDTFLERLGLTGSERAIINGIYETYMFNINYTKEKNGHYVAARNGEFSDVRSNIENLERGMDKIFSFFAAELMHLAVTEGTAYQPGNIAFHIGGSGFLMASEIIESIINEIENGLLSSLSVQASVKEENRYTIVDFLNNFTGPVPQDGKMPGIYKQVLDNVILTSSFNFNSLLSKAYGSAKGV